MKTMILGLCLVAAGCRCGKTPEMTPREPAWKISFNNPCEADGESGRPDSVYVTIEKDDPEAGPVRVSRVYPVGERLGLWKDGTGDATTTHRAYSARLGRAVDIDFDTKCVLRKIMFKKRVGYTYERCRMAASPAGMECLGKETVSDSFTTTEVLYTDADDKPVTVHIGGIKKTHPLCPEHGMKKE